MKKIFSFLLILLSYIPTQAQDTFSIVAMDTLTGEVGSAGASCVDLDAVFKTLPNDFLGELIPGVGGINTQASYDTLNQKNARLKMMEGLSPDSIISFLVKNDAKKSPSTRQYGIVGLYQGKVMSAGYTGSNAFNYKEHRLGPNYAIQGNILLGKQIIDSMEYYFNATQGTLACKLMAALQGAKVVGADTRCAGNNSSSLFSFIKVSLPTDTFGKPSFLLSVRTANGDSIEPIDSLQTLFNAHLASSLCIETGTKQTYQNPFMLYPNPSNTTVYIKQSNFSNLQRDYSIEIYTLQGILITRIEHSPKEIYTQDYQKGMYLMKIQSGESFWNLKLLVEH